MTNNTGITYQLLLTVEGEYLCGELRATEKQQHSFHIYAEDEYFSREDGVIYRNGKVYRDTIDPKTGNHTDRQLIRTNHARVMYELPENATVRD